MPTLEQIFKKRNVMLYEQRALCLLYFFEPFFGNLHPSREPGCKAGIGGLIPGEQARFPGFFPDVLLGQAAQAQRREHLHLL